jgi:excinuclease ABC subunit C
VVTRRFRRYQAELAESAELSAGLPGIDPTTGKARKFTYPPQLLVVDGGAPQVEAAQAALSELGMSEIAVVGLAKRLEEVWLPGDPDPVILPRTSEGLYLLQRVRDEAHRFAITYQRQKRGKRMIESLLDDVPGLGDVRRKAVLKQFGSLKRLRAASVEEIASVPGIGPSIAQAIFDTLAAHATAQGVNVTTGEIIE